MEKTQIIAWKSYLQKLRAKGKLFYKNSVYYTIFKRREIFIVFGENKIDLQ